jgi:hypothetical protein
MKLISLGKTAIAISTFACTALLSVGWSEQRGASLSIESAQARVGRPLTPVSVAGVARRQYRRAAYGYGAGVVGAGVAAAAIGTTAAVAAGTSPWGYYGGGPYAATGWGNSSGYYAGGWGGGYFAASPWGDYECRNPYGYPCNPYSSKDWWGTGTTAGYVARPYVGAGYYGVGPGYYGRPLARAAYYRATRY